MTDDDTKKLTEDEKAALRLEAAREFLKMPVARWRGPRTREIGERFLLPATRKRPALRLCGRVLRDGYDFVCPRRRETLRCSFVARGRCRCSQRRRKPGDFQRRA